MARIQILELPMIEVDGVMTTPFSIIIDQVEAAEIRDSSGEVVKTYSTEVTQDRADYIAMKMGAISAIISSGTLDLA